MKNTSVTLIASLLIVALFSSCAFWKTTGNAQTNPSNNFIGTTDDQDLSIRTDNTEKVRITKDGNVGIGSSSPKAPIEIAKSSSGFGHLFINDSTSSLPTIMMKNNYHLGYDDSWLIRSSSIPQAGATYAGYFFITHTTTKNAPYDPGTFGMTSSGMATIYGSSIFLPELPDYRGVYPPLGSNSRLTLVHTSANPEKELYRNHNSPYWDQPHLRLIQQNGDYARISFSSNWIRPERNYIPDPEDNTKKIWAEVVDSNVWVIRAKTNPDSTAERFSIYNWLHGGDLLTISGNHHVGIGTADPHSKLEVMDGDVYINNSGTVTNSTLGIIMKSPNGKCWRVTIDNNGNLVVNPVSCPN